MVFSGPTPEKSAVADSDFAEISACLETDSWSISPPLACGPSEWQWHPSLAGDKLAPGKIAHSVGEAALVDEPPASEVDLGEMYVSSVLYISLKRQEPTRLYQSQSPSPLFADISRVSINSSSSCGLLWMGR